jgi:DAK2 domain fusion protein YloV
MAIITRCDGILYKRSLFGSHVWLTANRDKINQLNVFPVPDGDTGTNMLLTLDSAIEEMGKEDEHDLSRVAHQVAHGALMGARGNSGVILSQVLRGFAQGVGDAVSVDCRQMAHAFAEATAVAYKGVTKPTEGTILTVARAASDAALRKAEETEDIAELIQTVVAASQRAVDETPSQLAVLREAGVVDAGGYGLMVILEGFLKTVKGQEIVPAAGRKERPAAGAPAKVGAHALDLPEEGWGFCTEFLIDHPSTPLDEVRETLSAMGTSGVIVGDNELVRVHVHTQDPGSVIARAAAYGQLLKLKVEDMSQQHHEILSQEPAAEALPAGALNGSNGSNGAAAPGIGVVAVAAGDGFRRIFEELGAGVVEGGQTMNPSTEDLLHAVEAVPADRVIILPNNKNVILSAQQVTGLCDKEVAVVPTRTVPQGISALLTLDPAADLSENTQAMAAAVKGVQTIEVTTAVRSTSVNGVKINSGDVIALVNGKITESGHEHHDVIERAVQSLAPETHELLTVYVGAEVSDGVAAAMAQRLGEEFPALTVETQRGEQSHYPYILSLE